jgi:hypothetical protein
MVTTDGADTGDFVIGALGATSLAAGEETEFTLNFSPRSHGVRVATVHVLSNDADEASFDIPITGYGLHTLESWRQEYYQTTANAGDAADLADPNNDGVSNLMAFAVGLNPLEAGVVPFDFQLNEDDLTVSYQRSRAAMAAGFEFDVEWSETLESDWSTVGVVEEDVEDDGVLQQVDVRLPKGVGKRFVRLSVTKP